MTLHHLDKPVKVYTAANNAQAHMLAALLSEQDIDAVAVEDVSLVGYYALGTMSQLHRPHVFVDETQAEAARAFLRDFEAKEHIPDAGSFCFHCGAELPETSVSYCPECHGNLTDANPQGSDSTPAAESRAFFKQLARLAAALWLVPLIVGVILAIWVLIKSTYL